MAEDKVAKLELRIKQLEDQVQGFRAAQPQDLTADEIRTYQKVSSVVAAGDISVCGINECQVCVISCLRCIRCIRCLPRCWPQCVPECVCGPCLASGGGSGGVGRFSGLGNE